LPTHTHTHTHTCTQRFADTEDSNSMKLSDLLPQFHSTLPETEYHTEHPTFKHECWRQYTLNQGAINTTTARNSVIVQVCFVTLSSSEI